LNDFNGFNAFNAFNDFNGFNGLNDFNALSLRRQEAMAKQSEQIEWIAESTIL
jgi:hypothetical protein